MINTALLTPRNLLVVAVFSLIAYAIFNHFTKAKATGV